MHICLIFLLVTWFHFLCSFFEYSENIFTTSCSKISEASVDQLKLFLAIRFEGEAGMVMIIIMIINNND